jgi:L-seryl-tRNA(Ser) seleniumtransferase
VSLRALPSVDAVLAMAEVSALVTSHGRLAVVAAIRKHLDTVRSSLRSGGSGQFEVGEVMRLVRSVSLQRLVPVVNCTGVVLHTNLGRAPLATAALERVQRIGQGYSNLELSLETGERGSRYAPLQSLLCALTGAEAALVVNNCAAAVMVTLAALAFGREVIVSRGELVEIGGGFRMPDVMRASGATLVEVGTTNRTRLADYRAALTSVTGLLVKVHQSNFAMVGFTEEAPVDSLATLAKEHGVPLFVDLGSGAMPGLQGAGLQGEPTVVQRVAQGADVVAFSGDKLLGGPQCGVLVGRATVLNTISKHPLMRAVRVDKLTVAALEATLELYQDGRADAAVPARRLISQTPAVIQARAERLRAALGGVGEVTSCEAQVGGGTVPQVRLPSFAYVPRGPAEPLAVALRRGSPPVLARFEAGRLLLDLFCVADAEVDSLANAVLNAKPNV